MLCYFVVIVNAHEASYGGCPSVTVHLSCFKASFQPIFVKIQGSSAYFQTRFNNNFVFIRRITWLNAAHPELRRRWYLSPLLQLHSDSQRAKSVLTSTSSFFFSMDFKCNLTPGLWLPSKDCQDANTSAALTHSEEDSGNENRQRSQVSSSYCI